MFHSNRHGRATTSVCKTNEKPQWGKAEDGHQGRLPALGQTEVEVGKTATKKPHHKGSQWPGAMSTQDINWNSHWDLH